MVAGASCGGEGRKWQNTVWFMLLAQAGGGPKHFDGSRFYNPEGRQVPGYLDALRWKLTSRLEASPSFISDVEASAPPGRLEGGALGATLVNHSTVLLQQSGSNILTDPIWSERASPCFLGRSATLETTRSILGRSALHRPSVDQPQSL